MDRQSDSKSVPLVTKLLYDPASAIGTKFVKSRGIHFLVGETTKARLYLLLKG